EVLGEVLGLVDHDAETLFDGDRELDEVVRVEADRALDALGQRRLHGGLARPPRVELEPCRQDRLQLVEHFLGFHHPPRVPVGLSRGATAPPGRPEPPGGLGGHVVAPMFNYPGRRSVMRRGSSPTPSIVTSMASGGRSGRSLSAHSTTVTPSPAKSSGSPRSWSSARL